MNNFNANDITSVLTILAEVSLKRNEEFSNFNSVRDLDSSDEECEFLRPYFDELLEQGETKASKICVNLLLQSSNYCGLWSSRSLRCPTILDVAKTAK